MIQAECYHYLFEAALKLQSFGLDPADPKHEPLKQLKIETSHTQYNGVSENGKTEVVEKITQLEHPDPVRVK